MLSGTWGKGGVSFQMRRLTMSTDSPQPGHLASLAALPSLHSRTSEGVISTNTGTSHSIACRLPTCTHCSQPFTHNGRGGTFCEEAVWWGERRSVKGDRDVSIHPVSVQCSDFVSGQEAGELRGDPARETHQEPENWHQPAQIQ